MPRRLFRTLLAAGVVSGSLVMLAPQSAFALVPTPDVTWSVGGKVYALAHLGGTVFAGGSFKKVTSATGQRRSALNLAAFDQQSGEWIPSFAPSVGNTLGGVKVNALAVSNDGTTL